MFNTISISELQRAGKKAFESVLPIQYVLSNNKKSGLILSGEALETLEKSGLLSDIEDQLLARHMDMTFDTDDFIELSEL